MKYLNDLYKGEKHIPIKNIKTDSRNIESGDLFVAIKGFNVDHSEFVDDEFICAKNVSLIKY